MNDLTRGAIRFGVSAMMGSYYFPEVLTSFKQDYPNIKIVLVDQGTSSLEKMLLNGELDLALIRADKDNVQLSYAGIIEEEIVAGLSTAHPLAKQHSLTLEQFCQQPLVLFHEGYFLREAVSDYSRESQINLDIRLESNLIELQKSMVKNEVGITTCLSMILQDEGDLVAIPFIPKIDLKLGLAWKKNHYLSKATKTFIHYLEQNRSV